MKKIIKMLKNPRHYSRRLGQMALFRLSSIFGQKSFYLQGRMDIHESSFWHNPKFVEKFGGFAIPGDQVERHVMKLDAWDTVRQDMLTLLLRSVLIRQIPGIFAEVGVYQGATARLIHHYAPERVLYLFDTFEGFTDRGHQEEASATGVQITAQQFSDTSVERVKQHVKPQSGNVRFVAGYVPDSIPAELYAMEFAFVHLDADLYSPIISSLNFFYPRMAPGGLIVVHDYNAWIGARTAVDEFMADKPEIPVPMPDKSGSVVIIKQGGQGA